jgi:DNA-binding NarL/FixJ family response regulator
MTFLIVDDNQRMRQSIRRTILRQIPEHHTFYDASDGGEAIDLYERFHPDWVLMDIKMEPIDGLAASRAIMAAHPDAKIIVLTQYDSSIYRRAAKGAGTRAFLLKEHLSEIANVLSTFPHGDASCES